MQTPGRQIENRGTKKRADRIKSKIQDRQPGKNPKRMKLGEHGQDSQNQNMRGKKPD